MSIPYSPLGNRVVIKPIPLTQEDKIINGIEVPESAIVFENGEVVASGKGEYAMMSGELMPNETKEGDVVKYRIAAPFLPLRIDGIEYKMMRESDLDFIVGKK